MDILLFLSKIAHYCYRAYRRVKLRCVFCLNPAPLGYSSTVFNHCHCVATPSRLTRAFDADYVRHQVLHQILVAPGPFCLSTNHLRYSRRHLWVLQHRMGDKLRRHEPLHRHTTALTAKAIRDSEVLSMINGLNKINFALFISRRLLRLQYLRGSSPRWLRRIFGDELLCPPS